MDSNTRVEKEKTWSKVVKQVKGWNPRAESFPRKRTFHIKDIWQTRPPKSVIRVEWSYALTSVFLFLCITHTALKQRRQVVIYYLKTRSHIPGHFVGFTGYKAALWWMGLNDFTTMIWGVLSIVKFKRKAWISNPLWCSVLYEYLIVFSFLHQPSLSKMQGQSSLALIETKAR